MQEQLSSSNFMNIKEVSIYLGIKTSGLYLMVEERRIPYYRIGRQIRFKGSEIDQWMLEQKQEVVDVNAEAKRVIRSVQKRPAWDIDRIVKKAIDEAKEKGYTLGYGKPDRIKGLRKEVKHGSL